MMGMNKLGLGAMVVAMLSTTSLITVADDTYYRWVDNRGNPVHSDRPPPEGVDYEVVSTGSSMVRKVDADEGAVPADLESTPSNTFDRVDTADNGIKKNPEFCTRARENLETLENFARIRVRNDQGEYRWLDDEEKESQKNQAREQITIHCE